MKQNIYKNKKWNLSNCYAFLIMMHYIIMILFLGY